MKLLRILPRFKAAQRAIRVLESRESWSRREIETWQLERINQLWQQASVQVPYYREIAQQCNLPPRFESLGEYTALMPVLTGSSLRSRQSEFLSPVAGPGKWYRTSGSTGSPLSVFREHQAHREVLAARYRFYEMWGLEMLDRMVYLWGRWSMPPSRWRAWPKYLQQRLLDRLRGRLRLPAYQLERTALQANLRKIASFRPAGIYGFAQAIHLLALEAMQEEFHCESLRAIVLTSEPALPRLVHDVRQAFAVPVTQEYGATECELIAGEFTDGTLRVREDIVHVETIPRDDGVHSIILTLLNNPAFPLLRYEISDASDQPLISPDKGFAMLGRVCGRVDDLVVTRNGGVLHPTRIDSVFEFETGNRVVRRFRVHQARDGSLLVKVRLYDHDRAMKFDPQRLAKRLQKLVGGFDVSIEQVDSIPTSSAGKHRTITSDRWQEQLAKKDVVTFPDRA